MYGSIHKQKTMKANKVGQYNSQNRSHKGDGQERKCHSKRKENVTLKNIGLGDSDAMLRYLTLGEKDAFGCLLKIFFVPMGLNANKIGLAPSTNLSPLSQ